MHKTQFLLTVLGEWTVVDGSCWISYAGRLDGDRSNVPNEVQSVLENVRDALTSALPKTGPTVRESP
ncbi:MAG: hypothetical protein IT454_10480 [Planctomycetes bacterium]|nr:hypothetical protein [Planctomycetota bacterium]